MKLPRLNFLMYVIISMQTQIQASSDNIPNESSQKGLATQQQQPEQLKYHPSMSCYACSTMDYENPADNNCRVMKQQHRLPPLDDMHHPKPTTESVIAHQTSSRSPSEPSLEQSPSQTSTELASQGNNGTSSDSNAQSSHIKSNTSLSTNQTNMKQTVSLYHGGHIRTPGEFIKTRPCFEDENFCSIVSVVRIEVAKENLISKFWAMERNCSKSCNTGCMLIGERVRLRVCSQCCRTPNCNIGSGTASLYHRDLCPILMISAIILVWIHLSISNNRINNVKLN